MNVDDNNLSTLQPKNPLRSLRTLKLCRNELTAFDPKFFPELRTLYLDENQIYSLNGVRRLRLLENFSARSQSGKTSLGIHGLSELRKVYLSGNALPLRLDRPFYNLQYLELAAIKLTTLPTDFASSVPNIRILNLSFNSLKDVTPLHGMTLLKRLFLIGNRISCLSNGTTETLLSLTELQVLDLR
jgi:Leucine-rich repeat (LRR) protein